MTHQTCYIALGANLGDAIVAVQEAIVALGQLENTTVSTTSSLYRSAPFEASGPDFINAVAQIQTTQAPFALLDALQTIEQAAGRARPYRNAPRTLDLDILFYGDLRMDTPALTLPHPRLWQRAFVLKPLHEIAPHLVNDAALAKVAEQAIERLA